MLFILAVQSYLFIPFLYNLSHRLTEFNVSLFYRIELIFFKNNVYVDVQAVKLNFIQQLYLQNILIKQDNF